ncbi:hypothetical protein FHS83_003800 [Rhizomicrobium palustre]|uniref:Uncharacterized protein n=1 Tax=Rhizomicrobium palustre TaxID=189966 RepID=A0A846N5P0_9PROT|nr:hypothetical protein [Rhizomicrobium palustre]NIK90482.1 hypothetical protein [Rhizomicrobium palustre]
MASVSASTWAIFKKSFRSMPAIWAIFLVVAAATNVCDLVYANPKPGHVPPLLIVSLLVRLLGVSWIGCAALRVMAESRAKPWGLDRGLLFCTFWGIVGLAVGALLARLFTLIPNLASGTALAPVWLYAGLAFSSVLSVLILLPFMAWSVALSVRETPSSLFRRMVPLMGPAFGAYLMLAFPLHLLHLGATAYLMKTELSLRLKLVATMGDGVESTILAMMMVALSVAVYRKAAAAI